MNSNNKTVVTLTGPSGSGKTVLSKLLQNEGFKVLVSVTTRNPREGEVEGEDYHFINRETFLALQDSGKLIEYTEYNGTFYGVTAEEAETAFEQGKHAVVVVEPHGKEQMKDICESLGWPIIRVFVDNDEKLLYKRLLNRLLLDVSGDQKKEMSEQSTLDAINSLTSADDNQDKKAFIMNVLQKFLSDHNQPVVGPQLEAAAKRLTAFKFEQDNWVKPARTEQGIYEVVFDKFDADVQNEVVKKVVELANSPAKPTASKIGLK